MYALRTSTAPALLAGILLLTGCNGSGTRELTCPMPEGHDLDAAIRTVQQSLTEERQACAPYFDAYVQRLLTIAEGDPKPENAQRFSDFLVWASAEGVISRRQAKETYNRYFNIVFVTLQSDYSVCSQTCPDQAKVMAEMAQELADKERGLLKINADSKAFYRADSLLKETELVLEATCNACRAQRR
jgi:hypothetical protein